MKKLRTVFKLTSVLAGVLFLASCGKNPGSGNGIEAKEDAVMQESDGSISLKIEKASFYNDVNDPSNNTAEWSVLLKKPGRFDVWLASATVDTMNLNYSKAVQLSIREKRLEVMPSCDKVVQDSLIVSYPYFRADSFLGSLYLQDTGLVNVQVISEKILPLIAKDSIKGPDTRMLALYLKPVLR